MSNETNPGSNITEDRIGVLPKAVWPAIALCVVLNGFVLTQIATHNPKYLYDYRLNQNPDARHYVLLGRNYLLMGEYSRCNSPPYVPDILRTPVYPLVAGGLDIVFGAVGIYVAQCLMHIISCVLLFHLVRPHFGNAVGGVAAGFLGSDLLLAISNFDAMSEMAHLFLTLAAAVCLFPLLFGQLDQRGHTMRLVCGSLLLGVATLTRPVGLYVPFVIAISVALSLVSPDNRLLIAKRTFAMLIVSFIPVGAWIARNYYVFSVPHLTNNDAIMLVYCAGSGAYEVEHGTTLDEARVRVSREFDIPPVEITNNHWNSELPVSEVDRRVRAVKWTVLTRYPKSMLISSVLGTAKASISHNVGSFAGKTDRKWIAPGMAGLLRAESSSLYRLGENDCVLIAAFAWELIHVGIVVVLAFASVPLLFRTRHDFPSLLALTMLLGYFLATVAVVGADATARSRIPHIPLLCVLAGIAAAGVLRLVFRRKDPCPSGTVESERS